MPRRRQHKTPPKTIFTATVENLSHDGRGIAHIQGKTTFIEGGLPGEEVHFHYLQQRSRFDEALVSQVLKPIATRCIPQCAHFGVCGGCLLQHMHLDHQLTYKQQVFQELLQHQAKLQPLEWLPPLSGPPWGYRRKARLAVKYVVKKNRLLIGFRERRGRFVADINHCPVLHPVIGERLQALSFLINEFSIRDKIPQIEVAIGDNHGAIIIRHLEPFSVTDLTLLKEFAIEHSLYVYLQPGGLESVHLWYPQDAKPLHYRLTHYDLVLEFQPWQFIQVNAAVNQKMIDQAISLLAIQPQDKILDLFCGIGNFSLPIARCGALVTGVEGDSSTVEQAIKNAQNNRLTNCQFYCSDLFSPPFHLEWAQHQYDKLLLDPPRSGAPLIADYIQNWNPSRIVYISCNLTTLVRDSSILCQKGYQLTKTGIMDMFPHTQHVEAIALFFETT